MRTLTDTLKKAQQAGAINALAKLVLTHNSTTYTYTKDRLLDIKETGDGSLQSIVIVLDNSDKVLTDIDLKGYKGVLSNGANTSAGEEYSACAPMWVLAQEFDSDPNKLTCTLSLIGICNLMSQDEASEAYQPDDTDTKAVKTLVNQIAGATLDCFSLCKAYDVVWDDGYDTLADTYKPKDNFRIYVGNNRNSAIDRLLAYTKNVKVVKADGKIHIFKPTTSGSTYDSEYSLDSGHPFFSKALRNRYVTPNYIKVESRDDDDPKYSGTAQDDSYATLPDELKKHHYKQTYLESDDQATAIAEAILAKAQMWCEAGAANVPMNVGTEVFDYVKVTDSREADYRVGNIGKYVRHYDVRRNEWRIAFNFGNWQNVRKVLANLNITADDVENYFSRLSVGDLYVENILADNVDFVWIDPDNTIDLSKIGDTFDNLPEGEHYYRARKMHLDGETGLTLWEGMKYYIRFSPDSDEAGIRRQDTAPSGVETGEYWIDTSGAEPIIKRWTGSSWFTIEQAEIDALNKGLLTTHTKLASLSVDGLVLLDEVQIGDDYGLVQKAALTAAGLVVLDQTVDGTYKKTLAADYSGSHIKMSALIEDSSHKSVSSSEISAWNNKPEDMDEIDMGVTWGKPKKDQITAQGYLKLNANTYKDGQWYNESGIIIDAASGIEIRGGKLVLKDSGGGNSGTFYIDSNGHVRLDATSWHEVRVKSLRASSKLYANEAVILTGGLSSQGVISLKYADYVDMPIRGSHPSGTQGGRLYYDNSKNLFVYYRSGVGWRVLQDNPY